MDALIVIVAALLLAVPAVAVAALCLAIGARRRNRELQWSVDALRLEVRHLRKGGGEGSAAQGAPRTDEAVPAEEAIPPEPVVPGFEGEEVRNHDSASFGHGVPAEVEPAVREDSGDPVRALAETLRRLGCWPPADEERMEASLGAWWATRLGILMAVIAAVFFGVYVSQDTPPWVRFAAVLAAGAGVGAAGLWLERTLPAFGRVVFAGGLGILYFAAFAAYAVPAMRVAPGPVSGGLLQGLAVALMLTAGLWKEREGLATTAVLLGYVSCVFAFSADLETYAWAGGFVLGGGAGVLLLMRGWRLPMGVALAGSWIVAALLVLTVWLDGAAPGFGFALTLLAGQFLFFLAIERAGMRAGVRFRERWRNLYHFVNSSAVLLFGWLFVREVFPEQLAWFYLVFGLLLLLVWVVFRRGEEAELLVSGYLVKGASLIALFLVTHFSGEVRWIALLVQATCLLPLLRERLRVVIDLVFYGVLAAGLGLFLFEITSEAGPHAVLSVRGLAGALFVLGLGCVLAVRRRLLPDSLLENHPSELLAVFGQVAVGVAAIVYVQLFFEPLGRVGGGLAFAVLFGVLDLAVSPVRRWFVSGGMAALFAYSTFLMGWPEDTPVPATLLAGAGVVIAFFAAGVVMARIRKRHPEWPEWREGVTHCLWQFALALLLFRVVPAGWLLAAALAGSWAAFLVSRGIPGAVPGVLSGLVFFFGLFFWAIPGEMPGLAGPAVGLMALLAVGYLFASGGVWPGLEVGQGVEARNRRLLEWSGGLVATAALALAVYEVVSPVGQVAALAAVAMGGTLAWRRYGIGAWGCLSVVLLAGAHVEAYRLLGWPERIGEISPALAFFRVAIPASILTVVFGLLTVRRVEWSSDAVAPRVWGVLGVAAMALPFLAAVHPEWGLAAYATVVWGVVAVALFATGLVCRVQSYRLVALGGVGLAVFRLFSVDIQDTLNRIIAFAVLAFVLLGIGFLYHRFRHRLSDADAGSETEGGESA